jgi:hypothetical protein
MHRLIKHSKLSNLSEVIGEQEDSQRGSIIRVGGGRQQSSQSDITSPLRCYRAF